MNLMVKNYNIQSANKNDLVEINQLLQAEDLPQVDPNEMTEYFFKSLNLQNKIIGAIGLEIYGKYGLLRSMVVDDNFRNNGIAGQLVDRILKTAAAIELSEIYLLTSTADKYFLKKGFKISNRDQCPPEIQQSKEYSSICPASSILLSRKIK